ncbi:Hypothetical predicted protein [Octopus vulgaris]|uniref:Uncharacterized protein n=1 Tax=Octopus vulgaris TaxID=6645 RepID=A0AA36FMY1_OCTVU|nr:Hypothetical predicted protein [Octopus vulgaris]
MASQSMLCCFFIYAVVQIISGHQARVPYRVSNLMNVVLPQRYIPVCPTLDHVCGRVWRKGIYIQHICSCPGKTQCSMEWDDSVTGRSFQVKKYVQDKYCGPAKVERVCAPKEISFSVVSAIKPQREVYRQGVVCLCKSPYGVHQNAIYELRDRNDLKYVHVFSCGKLPKCTRYEPCAQYFTNIENGRRTENFIARVNLCTCPRPQHCIKPRTKVRQEELVGPGNIPYDLHYCSA